MIECNTGCGGGAPVLNGTRLTVYDIVSKIEVEGNLEVAVCDYEITMEDAKDAVHYCVNRICETQSGLPNFCPGCVLRGQADGEAFYADDYEEVTVTGGSYWKSKKDDSVFMGTLQELEKQIMGEETWLTAGRMLMQYTELHP